MEEKFRRLQLIELEILSEVDRICKENEIRYFLDSGTALGAVRHQGFIPWDDDIDIGMMREDYERFIEVAPKCLKDKFFLQTLKSDPRCPCLFAKVRKNGTTFMENNKKGLKMHTGIYIDIFPFDFVPSDEKQRNKMITKIQRYKILFGIKKIPHKMKNVNHGKVRFWVGSFVRRILHIILSMVPDSFFVNRFNSLIESVVDKEYVSCLYYGKPIVLDYMKMVPYDTVLFEGKRFPCVNDNDYFLTVSYGDYMDLPPEEKRVGHMPLFVDFGEE